MSEDPVAAIRRLGVVPIARGVGLRDLAAAAAVLLAEGMGVVEVTLNTPDAIETIRHLRDVYQDRLVLGAGTVLDAAQAEQAVAAGARFLVTPHVDGDVAAASQRLGVPLIAGALTPTEILQAWRGGAALVKVFPAATVGAEYLTHLRGPLGQIPLVPTGGITVDNTSTFIAAGAAAVGVGGSLLGARANDPAWLRQEIGAFAAAVDRGRRARA
ncbi:MAG TPA: bifunctional 4-hydroxy-2-oxoglutarate aldolase/2-dehydro-3-deoxy-phosphogluconate aldolase [bacterium]